MLGKFFNKNRRRNSEPAAVPYIDLRLRQLRMIEATPINVYGNSSMDHGYESGTSVANSRRSSFGIREQSIPTASQPSRRRYTMQSRNQLQRPVLDNSRKTSYQMGPTTQQQQTVNDEDDLKPIQMNRRRMSVPEMVHHKLDFAIMRPVRLFSNASSYEILSAFDRHTDPYQTFMKSFSCYELQPQHNSVLLFEKSLKVKTAVNGLNQQGNTTSIVINMENYAAEGIFSESDCLNAISLVVSGDKEVASKTLSDFCKTQSQTKMIYSGIDDSVWKASQVLSLNRLYAIPIFETTSPKPASPQFFLTVKLILTEMVLKLTDFGDAILLHVRQATIEQKRVGTWTDITTIHKSTTIEDAFKVFVETKFSTIPVVNDNGELVGIVTRRDLISGMLEEPNGNYSAVLRQPVSSLTCMKESPLFGIGNLTVYETILRMINTNKQCIPIINDARKIIAIISYGDFLSYIQNCSLSVANRTPSNQSSEGSSSSSINTNQEPE